ncbi:hypothetical protein C0J52_09757 [Blattella germanica]|nr:hypothetical protein C0J52_09757 [Blattella germanica]
MVTPWSDYRMKFPAWTNERWTIFLPTPITYQPEVLSRLGLQTCNCIDGNICPEFLKMLDYRSVNTDELRRLTCGFKGFLPMVCCNQVVSQRTNYVPTSEVFHQVNSQAPEEYDSNCEQNFQPTTTVQQRINPSPTPFHTPGVYYNVASFREDTIPLDDSYIPTSERNYYNKRFSHDSGFHQEINYVTPRTFMHDSRRINSNPNIHSSVPMNTNMYPEFVMKTHDVPMMYSNVNSNPSPGNFGNNPSAMYPKLSQPNYKPSSDSTPRQEQWNSKPETHNNPHVGNNNPTYSNFKPTTDGYYSTNHNVPKSSKPNITLNETQIEYNTSNIPLFSLRPDDSGGVVVGREAKRKLLPTIECGVPPGERIVGGKTAQLGEYPWIVRIGYTPRFGSTINSFLHDSNETELTAENKVVRYCIIMKETGPIVDRASIRLGELDERTDPDCYQSECGDPVQDYVASHVKVHEEYDNPRFRNDLALIRLDRSVNYTRGTSSSPVLQWVRVTVIPTGTCAREFADRTGTRLGPGQICAGGERGRDSCEGDSGGPLMRGEQLGPDDFTRYYLLGLVSFGAKRCGSENLPGVYTDIPAYLDWILDNIET